MPSYRGPRKNQDSFSSLREHAPIDGLSALQVAYLGAFLEHVLEREMAIYVATVGQGRGIRVRVFNGDDRYEDVLSLSEDWGLVLDSYAKVLGGLQEWRAKAAKVHAAAAQEAPGATARSKP